MERRLISSGQPLEREFGYSRAVAVGDRVYVAGTVANMEDGTDPPPDAYAQAKRAIEIVVAALAEAGAQPKDVVRVRMFVTDAAHMPEVARAYREVFGEFRPTTTGLVAQLLDPRWLVEIEVDAELAQASDGA